MIAAHRRRIEKTDREKIFIISHADDFPKGSAVEAISVEIDAKLTDFLARDAALASLPAVKLQALEVKGDTRDFLIASLSDIATGAIAIDDEAVPGITAKFTLPVSRSDESLLATADEWLAAVEPYETLFVTAGLEPDFRSRLQNSRNDFQNAIDTIFNSSGGVSEAFDQLDDLMRDIMNLARRRSALVRLKYRGNPAKLASWSIAAHLDQPPKRRMDIVMQVV